MSSLPNNASLQSPLDPRDSQAAKDVGKALLVALLAGGSLRAAVGIGGNISRNLRRKEERDDANKPGVNDMLFTPKTAGAISPVEWGEDKPNAPSWMLPALLLGAPLSAAGGWAGVGKLMKHYRKSRSQDELENAKREFEEALAEEQSTKLACELDDLANAYVSGELDTSTEKQAEAGALSSLWGAYLTALLGVGGIGAYGGWKMMGRSADASRVKAYREAKRRRQMARSISLTARSSPDSVTPQHDEPDEEPAEPNPESEEEYADNIAKEGGFGKSLIGGALGAGLGLYGGKKLIESNRGQDWKRQEAIKTVRQMLEGDAGSELVNTIYATLMPQLKQQFRMRNPMLSRIFGNAVS